MVQYAIFLDTETNSLYPGQYGRPLEIAFIVMDLISGENLVTYSSVIKQTPEVWEKSQPGALACNGFTWELLQTGKTEAQVAQDIKDIFRVYDLKIRRAVFICQNPYFDRRFFNLLISEKEQWQLRMPFHWFDLASMHLFRVLLQVKSGKKHPSILMSTKFSKDCIAEYYKLPPEEKPHRALNGVKHLKLIFENIIQPKTKRPEASPAKPHEGHDVPPKEKKEQPINS